MISVILATARADPQFEHMADSLAEEAKLVGVPIEWIVVDMKLWNESSRYARRDAVSDAVKGRFDVVHVPPKPSKWQGPYRLTSRNLWDKAGASNTGLIHAQYPNVVFHDDCTVFEEGWLRHHFLSGCANIAACGGYKYAFAGSVRIHRGRVVEGTIPSGDHRLVTRDLPAACPGGWMYGGNASAPLEACLKVNGYDEIMSGQGGLEDCEFGLRISRVVPLWFLPHANIVQLQDSHEAVPNFLGVRSVPCKGYRYVDEHKVVHHMTDNHKPIWRLLGYEPTGEDGNGKVLSNAKEEQARIWTLGNEYSLTELRKLVQQGKELPRPRDEWALDWRDGRPLLEM